MYALFKANFKVFEAMNMANKEWDEFLKRHGVVDPYVVEKEKKKAMQEGLQKGRQEGILDTALNLLKLGVDIKKISEGTGLPVSAIQQLQY